MRAMQMPGPVRLGLWQISHALVEQRPGDCSAEDAVVAEFEHGAAECAAGSYGYASAAARERVTSGFVRCGGATSRCAQPAGNCTADDARRGRTGSARVAELSA